MPAFETGINKFFPDFRQITYMGTEHIYSLATGELCIEIILFSNPAYCDQPVGSNFSSGYAGNHRIGASFLNIGKEAIVSIL